MSEPTSTTPSTATDDRARTWAFTALGLSLAAVLGGGILSNGLQMVLLDRGSVGNWSFALTVVAVPLALSAVAMWLGSNAVASTDTLARPVGRAAQTIAGLAILGAVLVLLSTLTRSM